MNNTGEYRLMERNPMNKKILLVDDEKDIADILRFSLEKKGYMVTVAYGGEEAICLIRSEFFDLLVTDLRMPPPDGLEVMKEIRAVSDETEIVVITGYPSVDTAVRALRDFSAYDFCTKPLRELRHFHLTVEKALERQALRKEKANLMQKLEREIEHHRKTEKILRKSEKELKAEKQKLEDSNTALKVLLEQRNADRAELEKKMLFNINKLVMPWLEKLKCDCPGKKQKICLDIIECNLRDAVMPFINGFSPEYFGFTPREIEICNLVRQGRTSKEIADLFCISVRTVETHRNSIRKKISLDKNDNLRAYLMSSH